MTAPLLLILVLLLIFLFLLLPSGSEIPLHRIAHSEAPQWYGNLFLPTRGDMMMMMMMTMMVVLMMLVVMMMVVLMMVVLITEGERQRH